jgi:hypothetical protein
MPSFSCIVLAMEYDYLINYTYIYLYALLAVEPAEPVFIINAKILHMERAVLLRQAYHR